VEALEKKKKLGLAAIVFESPRKGVFQKALPSLLSLEIPFSLMVDPDYVGLNRLPMLEELNHYRKNYSNQFSENEFNDWIDRSRKNPEETNEFLIQCRKELGPLPLEDLDPLSFFATWGKIADLPSHLVDYGISFSHEIQNKDQLENKVTYWSQQLRKRPSIIRAPAMGFTQQELEIISKYGFRAVLGNQIAAVEKTTNLFDLPIWNLN
jgi:hypothetical protein